MNVLLIVSCSQRKNPAPGLLPALQRYTGGVYQVIHRACREGYWPSGCQLAIVSARYGLLLAGTPIACYDLKMTHAQAVLLRPQVSSALDDLLLATSYDALFLNLGAFYRLTVQESCELERLRLAGCVLEAQGGLGQRLQQTKRWLREIGRSDAASSAQIPGRT